LSILIRHGTVLTVDAKDTIFRDGFVLIEGDRITQVGDMADLPPRAGDEEIDATEMLVLPGFVNAHAHFTDSLVRSLGADLPLLPWLEKLIWPFFSEARADDIRAGALLGSLEAIKSGTTTVVENYYSSKADKANIDSLAEAFLSSGLRTVLVRGYHDRPEMSWDVFLEETDELLAEYERIIETWHGHSNGRLMIWVGPVDLLSSLPDSIQAVHALAQRFGVGVHSHVAETESELEFIQQEYGQGYVQVLDSLGVLDPMFTCAHAVWVDEEEIEILAERGAGVVHNPISNMCLGSGIAPVPDMLSRGVTVALGTDGACCNNTLDMVETMKAAALIHKVGRCDPAVISAPDVLRMATINGARVLGLQHEIGSIEVGKKADLIILDLTKARTTPNFDPVASLVYSSRGSDVETVIVDGEFLMKDRSVKVFEEEEILRRAQRSATALVERVPALAQLAGD